MSSIVVTNISADVTQQQLESFFSFCGTISSIEIVPATSTKPGEEDVKLQAAKVHFSQDSAAQTALLLHDTQLGSRQLIIEPDNSGVAPPAPSSGAATGTSAPAVVTGPHEIAQEDKPKTTIFAEILSHGYQLSDQAIQKSVDLDKKHGFSDKFNKFLTDIDTKYNVSERASSTAHEADQKYGIREHVQSTHSVLNRYFDRALDSKAGASVRKFYKDTSKSAQDIHHEARRLADLRTGKPNGSAVDQPQAEDIAITGSAPPPVSADPVSESATAPTTTTATTATTATPSN
ncbi:uncharacterized protein V1516DRAFT_548553 [Lipomyces oligophaga]|uniref:uncharacterized protein n=1 Tax=Lipomyces oligophaga TaxID=45792 RepID=UPI0034CD91E6